MKSKFESIKAGSWKNVETLVYKNDESGSFKNIVRKNIIDKSYINSDFELRYFEIGKKGFSSLEKHKHTHMVIVVKGEGIVKIGKRNYSAKPFDIFYIDKNQPHQLKQKGGKKFGFFCIVNKKRDKPVLI